VGCWAAGNYAPAAQVLHSFESGLRPFLRRFVRYGRGNRFLAPRHQVDLASHLFAPCVPSFAHGVRAFVQFVAMWWGYHTTWPGSRWSGSSPLPAWSCHMSATLEPAESRAGVDLTRRWASGDAANRLKDALPHSVAVLIDGDNISPDQAEAIQREASVLGPIGLVRVYCTQASRHWEQAFRAWSGDFGVSVVGKNADLALAMGAEEILHTTSIREIVLATNDGDFASVARRLRNDANVVGMGDAHASADFKAACSRFISFPSTKSKVPSVKCAQKRAAR
jgi:uncharacterized LabA/DUF88 family protein